MPEVLSETLRHVGELGWQAFQAINTRIADSESIKPGWAPGPLPKSYQRTQPPLGWPRETDSLCPRCVIEVRNQIIQGLSEEGPEAYVAGVMDRDYMALEPSADLAETLPLMARGGRCALIKDGNRLVGLLTTHNLSEFLLLRQCGLEPLS